jgi:hypothetical protein
MATARKRGRLDDLAYFAKIVVYRKAVHEFDTAVDTLSHAIRLESAHCNVCINESGEWHERMCHSPQELLDLQQF